MKSTKIAFVVDGQSFQKICLKDREDGKLETQQGPALEHLWWWAGLPSDFWFPSFCSTLSFPEPMLELAT